MAAMSLEQEIDSSFGELLEKEGFVRQPEGMLSFVRSGDDGSRRDHVDIEIRRYLGGFGVTLQEVARDGKARRQLLEEFQGLKCYALDQTRPETIRAAIDRALDDLRRYGMAWFAGQTISTPATERVRALVADRAYHDLVTAARKNSKEGAFERAFTLFEEASRIRQLGALDEKYRLIAERKVRE
jgi:hypothetical protein